MKLNLISDMHYRPSGKTLDGLIEETGRQPAGYDAFAEFSLSFSDEMLSIRAVRTGEKAPYTADEKRLIEQGIDIGAREGESFSIPAGSYDFIQLPVIFGEADLPRILLPYATGERKAFIRLFKENIIETVMQLLIFDPHGLPFALNVAITMCFVWLYTNRGGVRSLIWTDTLKTVCLVSSLVLCIVFIARSLGMSGAEVVDSVETSRYSRIFFFDDPSSPRYFWKMFFSGLFVVVAMTGLDQDMMQLNLSCRTKRDAKINIMITDFFQIIILVLFLALGVMLYSYADSTGLEIPEKSDQLFAQVAVNGGLPTIVGVVFVLGLISSTYSAAGSALTALTTSFTVDILNGPERYDERRLTRVRRTVHVVMAVIMGLSIVAFDLLSDDSTINLIYKVVSFTYGPILGMFVFGMFTRWRIRGRYMPFIAVASPLLSALLQYAAREFFDYHIGFELLVYNAMITMAGMMLVVRRNEN